MTTVVIVQARMGSSRLPGKVMKDLTGKPVLARVLERCRDIPNVDAVVCAVPDEDASAPLEAVATQCGAATFRGSEMDVLARYLGAARAIGADIVVRVTSDCPLIDPDICGRVLDLRAAENADYASNVTPRSFPQGLDCEVFTLGALEIAKSATADVYDREHVTPWLRHSLQLKRANLASGRPQLGFMRWTLDYPEDLDFFRAVFAELPLGSGARMDDVLAVLAARPYIAEINSCHRATTI